MESKPFSPHSNKLELLFVTLGIYSSYLYFGLLQEHIYTNPKRDPFIYPQFIVFCQLFISYIITLISTFYIVLLISRPPPAKIPLKLKLSYSASYSYSMFLTNFSLTLISYPTQALAKSCKILPAMMGSLFVKDVHYHILQYISVVMITIGVLIFNLNGKSSGNDSLLGITALFGSLFLDSISAYYTEHMRRNFNPSSLQALHFLSLWGSALIFPIVLVFNIVLPERSIFEYIVEFPDVLVDIILFSILSAVGQMFIFWGLKSYGAVTVPVITTTRKFMTIIVSIMWFNHTLNNIQMMCMLLVFSGTGIDLFVSHFMGKEKNKE